MSRDSAKKLPQQLVVPWKSWEALTALVLAFLLPVVVYVVVKVIFTVGHITGPINTLLFGAGPTTETFWYLIQVLGEIALLGLLLRRYKLGPGALGLRKFKFWQALGLVVLSYILFMFCLAGVYALIKVLFPVVNLDQTQVTGFEGVSSSAGVAMGFIVLVILAPIVEELFFRGLLFPAFLKRQPIVLASMLSSLIFGVFHAQLNIGIYTALLGLFLCFLYYRLGSIIPGISLHMINNLLAFLVLFKFIS